MSTLIKCYRFEKKIHPVKLTCMGDYYFKSQLESLSYIQFIYFYIMLLSSSYYTPETSLSYCISPTEYTEWQCPLSGIHFNMRVKAISTFTYKVVVYATTEMADTTEYIWRELK
jgi:hypothetical protein